MKEYRYKLILRYNHQELMTREYFVTTKEPIKNLQQKHGDLDSVLDCLGVDYEDDCIEVDYPKSYGVEYRGDEHACIDPIGMTEMLEAQAEVCQ
jgi:hypothetical protein